MTKIISFISSASTISHVSEKVCHSETLGGIFVVNVESNSPPLWNVRIRRFWFWRQRNHSTELHPADCYGASRSA